MLKVGVIGLGSMGKNHVRVYSEFPDVELVGVADVDYGLAQSLAERYHTKPFNDYKDLLRQGLDAVSIAVPTSQHCKVAVEAAHAGVNILVEKPIAETVETAKEIIKAAEKNNLKLMVGHIERFNPAISAIKKEMEGVEISLIEITRIGPMPPRINDVGVTIDLATHDIDLIRYLTNSEFKKIHGFTSRNVARHEDIAVSIFEMVNGVLARVTVNWLTPYKVRDIIITSRGKLIKSSLIDQKVTEYSEYRENGSYLVREIEVPWDEPLKLELRSFIDAVQNNGPLLITGEDGLKAIEVAITCLSSEA